MGDLGAGARRDQRGKAGIAEQVEHLDRAAWRSSISPAMWSQCEACSGNTPTWRNEVKRPR